MKIFYDHFDNHFNENFVIKEVGMKLSKNEFQQIRSRLKDFENEVPSNSTITLTFSRNKSKIWPKAIASCYFFLPVVSSDFTTIPGKQPEALKQCAHC